MPARETPSNADEHTSSSGQAQRRRRRSPSRRARCCGRSNKRWLPQRPLRKKHRFGRRGATGHRVVDHLQRRWQLHRDATSVLRAVGDSGQALQPERRPHRGSDRGTSCRPTHALNVQAGTSQETLSWAIRLLLFVTVAEIVALLSHRSLADSNAMSSNSSTSRSSTSIPARLWAWRPSFGGPSRQGTVDTRPVHLRSRTHRRHHPDRLMGAGRGCVPGCIMTLPPLGRDAEDGRQHLRAPT